MFTAAPEIGGEAIIENGRPWILERGATGL
jgi:hypothetical protein